MELIGLIVWLFISILSLYVRKPVGNVMRMRVRVTSLAIVLTSNAD